MTNEYDPYGFRLGKTKLNNLESGLMLVLIEFGASIDPQGYDDGDYRTAIKKIQKICGDFTQERNSF